MPSDRNATFPPARRAFLEHGANVRVPPAPIPRPLTREAEAQLHDALTAAYGEARLTNALREVGRELGTRETGRCGR